MRLLTLTMAEVRFQWKYGFYFLYAIFLAVYLLALSAVPETARRIVASAMIFTDPAAMGLFFMGAMVLMEKSQHVNCALSVSPVRAWEYALGKLFSLAAIGLCVGAALALAGGVGNIALCLVGVLLMSFVCSACGMIAAQKCKTLNGFILLAVPFELFLCLPPLLLLFGANGPYLWAHPGVAAARLIYGGGADAWLCVASLVVWCALALCLCLRSVKRGFSEGGAMP